ncbi:leucine-rich repeat protein [Butyribacter sp.]|uniref:leucine-rich repeat domain-containing protein n=1 Tax=Butyribacter sp. TaxID=2822465 RepID=UPI002A93B1A0|nr:leucine-rich repeat protein [Butyribacter sp.]
MNRKKKSMRKRILAWALAVGIVVSGYSGNGFVMKTQAAENQTGESDSISFGDSDNKFTYKIKENKLAVSYSEGKGEMPDYDDTSAPWKEGLAVEESDSNSIKGIEIGEKITSIGKNTFTVASGASITSGAAISENNSVKKVVLPTTLKKINSKAFANLKKLDTLIIGSTSSECKVLEDSFEGSKSPDKLCYLGEGSSPTTFGGMNFQNGSGTTDVTISITKHYYDSEGKAESRSATTDKYIPKDIAEGTFYDGTSYNIKNFPRGKDSEYTWYTDEKMTVPVNTDIKDGAKLKLYGKKKGASPSGSPSTVPSTVPTKDPVSPKQQPVIGNVTCVGKVSPTTSYDKVTLTRTDNTVPGTLKLKPTDFSRSGSNQCDYVFTPTDTSKYAEVTGKVWVNVDRDTLTSITADGTLQKGTYKYGESFDISGLKVTAIFQSGKSKDVTNYVKATELKVGTTSVDISYTFDSITKKVKYTGFVVGKGDIPSGAPKDTEVDNTIKTVRAASTTVLGAGSRWYFDSTKSSTVIPAGGNVEVTATYGGSDASSYTTITKTVKISRQPCVDDNKIVYTGNGEKAPTCTTAGVGHTVCSKCGDVMRTNIPVAALGHNIEYVAAKTATCVEKGNDAYYKCKTCGKTYVDSAGKTEVTVKTYDALGHKFDGQTPTYTWSSDHKRCDASITCKVCNNKVTETAESVCTTLQEATCQSEGEALYMVDFKNTAFSVQFEYGKIPRTGHFLKKTDRVEATDTTEGNIEYYECTVCKKLFYDSTGLIEITDKSSIVIQPSGVKPTSKPSETTTPSETPKPSQATPKPVGTSVRDTSGAIYRVTSSDSKNPTVEYKKTTAVVGGKVNIKSSVKVLGINYKITAIAANTFKNNKKITSVTVGSNVTSIGKSAFEKCTKLKGITLSKNVEDIGKNAFKNCKNLNTITIKSTKLDVDGVKKGAFSGIGKKVVVKVPKSKYSAYKKLLREKGLNKKVKIKKI